MSIKKLIVEFKKWLILKLGGYICETSEIKVYKAEAKPIRLCATTEISLPFDIPEKHIEEHLISLIAKEIKNKHLYKIECYENFERNSLIYRINVLMVKPTWGCENG